MSCTNDQATLISYVLKYDVPMLVFLLIMLNFVWTDDTVFFAFQGVGFKPGGDMHEPNIEVVIFHVVFYKFCLKVVLSTAYI